MRHYSANFNYMELYKKKISHENLIGFNKHRYWETFFDLLTITFSMWKVVDSKLECEFFMNIKIEVRKLEW